ncbi:Nucleotide-binding universal stress protein, UspA family [Paenimyroides aquimaris]|uniref:Nucleotide-binding universal stress protein, UspA family n=1 Tax=Paenimyroides marinum TaxID=1159016 RepID=A0A1H6KYS8_9FLAO|nr:universal stress protein [Paenimyroides aquimaris]SEH76909.1 Nucleotide-binding universal stress protein, UspA family [Paenimyroides aquimaris]
MKKILFPTDFSETANNAFVYALKLAKSIGAEIYVLNTYEMPVISTTSAGQPELIQNVYNSIELNHFENYKKEVPKLRNIAEQIDCPDIKLTFIFEEGIMLSIIQKIISQEAIDFIVMGTNGNSGFEKKLLGSNTVHVMENVDIPILSVPRKAEFKRLNNFGFATMLRESDKPGLRQIIKIAQSLNADMKILHVLRKENPKTMEVLEDWKKEFNESNVSFHTVLNEKLEDSVFFFIDDQLIDVMCIVKRHLNFFEKLFTTSLSKQLSYHADVPVLVLKEPKNN